MTMTREELAEWALAERLAFYTRAAGDTTPAKRAAERRREQDDLDDALARVAAARGGQSVQQLMDRFALTRREATELWRREVIPR